MKKNKKYRKFKGNTKKRTLAKFHVTHCYFDFIKQTEKEIAIHTLEQCTHTHTLAESQLSILIRDSRRSKKN